MSVNNSTDSLFFELCESVFKEVSCVYYFPLTLVAIIITIILMSRRSDSIGSHHEPILNTRIENNPDIELSIRLLKQVVHNQCNPRQPLRYNAFPVHHEGHLNLELRIRLVSILQRSILADKYRYGVSLGTVYEQGSYRYAEATPEMAGVVFSIETRSPQGS
jgi:hypothetical protein